MLRVGIVGMGGFAAAHQRNMLALEDAGICGLVCTCDPALDKFEQQMSEWNYAARGIKLFTDYTDMLANCAGEMDFVIVPTPINLHAPMHCDFVRAGVPVYLEKPPTLDYDELQSMLQVEVEANLSTNVGFNFTVEDSRQRLKQRILDGEFGTLRRVELYGHWPRPDSYYLRNNWAGRLMLGEKLVLDSIMGNAMAHYVHNVLLWCGDRGVLDWAGVTSVAAELYRANQIQGADTVFVEAQAAPGTSLRIALTHACNGVHNQYERLIFDDATIEYFVGDRYTITGPDGTQKSEETDRRNLLFENVRHYAEYIAGKQPRPLNLLSDCVPFVVINGLAYISSGGVSDIPDEHKTRSDTDAGHTTGINGIEDILNEFLKTGAFPSAQGLVWGRKCLRVEESEIGKLRSLIESIVSSQNM